MRSLHSRLIAGILLAVLVLFTVGGFLAYKQIRARLYGEFDANLVQRAKSLADLIEYEPSNIDVDWLEEGEHPPGHEEGFDFVQVVDPAGNTLTATEGIATFELWKDARSFDDPAIKNITLGDGTAARAGSFSFVPSYDPEIETDDDDDEDEESDEEAAPIDIEAPIHLVIAKLDTVAGPLASIRSLFLSLLIGLAAAAAATVFLVVRGALTPLGQLRNEIASLDDTVDGQRIEMPDPPQELAPIKSELNRLLERVEHAIQRERRLTSNLAHELRTPVAGILSSLEVTLDRPRENDTYRESAEECFEIAKRMHWLVTNLLSLSRIEAGNVQLQSHVVPLLDSLVDWWSPFETAAKQKDISIEWTVAPDAKLETDPEFLRVVMTNLFENATSYAPEGTTIRIEASSDGIWVENQAADLSTDSVEHVFDPFWREQSATTGSAPHAGLGLNLSKRIVELLGGRISAAFKEPEQVFRIELEFT